MQISRWIWCTSHARAGPELICLMELSISRADQLSTLGSFPGGEMKESFYQVAVLTVSWSAWRTRCGNAEGSFEALLSSGGHLTSKEPSWLWQTFDCHLDSFLQVNNLTGSLLNKHMQQQSKSSLTYWVRKQQLLLCRQVKGKGAHDLLVVHVLGCASKLLLLQ